MKPAGLLSLIATSLTLASLTAGCGTPKAPGSTSESTPEKGEAMQATDAGTTQAQGNLQGGNPQGGNLQDNLQGSLPRVPAPKGQAFSRPAQITQSQAGPAAQSPPQRGTTSAPNAASARPQPGAGRENPFALAQQPEFQVRYLPAGQPTGQAGLPPPAPGPGIRGDASSSNGSSAHRPSPHCASLHFSSIRCPSPPA
ncbi:MAG: hypothetical protein HC824_05130, partial [Synechococcales cyanobacterium RM1_1_8]|nr:hypothetical protein [Synechococcales cyanobacterium RM1_1_8]